MVLIDGFVYNGFEKKVVWMVAMLFVCFDVTVFEKRAASLEVSNDHS